MKHFFLPLFGSAELDNFTEEVSICCLVATGNAENETWWREAAVQDEVEERHDRRLPTNCTILQEEGGGDVCSGFPVLHIYRDKRVHSSGQHRGILDICPARSAE